MKFFAAAFAVLGASAPVLAAVPAPATPVLSAKEIYQQDAPSVVLILAGRPSGQGELGTGSVIDASGRVVTNAHVVAGVRNPFVIDARGRHSASVVLFDPELDMAVLRASDLAGPPLALSSATASRGTGGAVLGYPGGGPFTVGAAAVLTDYAAIGRDIYGRGLITRHVYQLQAQVRPGNSGGPLVLADGTVAGVVFARSVTNGDVGYALAADAVRARLARAETSATTTTASTGACVAD